MPGRRSSPNRAPSAPQRLQTAWGHAELHLGHQALSLRLLAGRREIGCLRLYGELPSLDAAALRSATREADSLRLAGESAFGAFALCLTATKQSPTLRLDLSCRSAFREICRLRLQDHGDPAAGRAAAFEAPDTLRLAPSAALPWAVAVRLMTDAVPEPLQSQPFGVSLNFPEARETVVSLELTAVSDRSAARAQRRADALLEAAFCA